MDPNSSLKAGGRSGQSDGGLHVEASPPAQLAGGSEIAFSLILLVGAGLLMRSFVRLQNVAPGFTTDHVMTMEMVASDSKYHDDKVLAGLYRDIEARIAHLPGVWPKCGFRALPLTGTVGWAEST